MGGSWLQHRGQHPGRAAQQAGATRNGRGGSPLGLSVVVHAPHGRDNPGVSSERARVCGPQWAALGSGTVARAPGVLPNRREPLGTAAGVTSVYPAP